jgi:hypothetical protein
MIKKTRAQNSQTKSGDISSFFAKKDPSTPKHWCGKKCTGLACNCACKNCALAIEEREKIDKSVV